MPESLDIRRQTMAMFGVGRAIAARRRVAAHSPGSVPEFSCRPVSSGKDREHHLDISGAWKLWPNKSVEPTATALTFEDAMKAHCPAPIAAPVAHLWR
jgi:hypothetical protein